MAEDSGTEKPNGILYQLHASVGELRGEVRGISMRLDDVVNGQQSLQREVTEIRRSYQSHGTEIATIRNRCERHEAVIGAYKERLGRHSNDIRTVVGDVTGTAISRPVGRWLNTLGSPAVRPVGPRIQKHLSGKPHAICSRSS